MFWSTFKKGDTLRQFTNRKLSLSAAHSLTLLSHKRLGNVVYLFTYNDFSNVSLPNNIKIFDAHFTFPKQQAYNALSRGHSIAHVSDVVRIKESVKHSGIVIDMDVVVLREMNKVDTFYSSMPAKMTGGVAPQWGKSHPPIHIHDKSWDGRALCCFPLKAGKANSKQLLLLAAKIENTLAHEPKNSSKAWNYVLWTVKDIIKQDKTGKVYQPLFNVPIPAWKSAGNCYSIERKCKFDGVTKVFGYTMPSEQDIFNKSFMVGHFFESAFSDSDNVSNSFWKNLPESCFLAKEAIFILGKNWRKILINFKI